VLQVRDWQLAFPNEHLTISINLSGRQFVQPDLIETIDQILQETGVERQNVKLEITEGAIMENAESSVETASGKSPTEILEHLRLLGVQLGIDDFGTGYSSLSRLYRFPINTLKIDQSFIKRMDSSVVSNNDRCPSKIVRAIVMLAHNLGLDVIAEGIETPEQLSGLRELGCEFGQGYFFSKPVALAKAEALIAAQPQW
jgi:EAL domain-containing protein (putative c-di-GMP-specific phosphodiesterase class I)